MPHFPKPSARTAPLLHDLGKPSYVWARPPPVTPKPLNCHRRMTDLRVGASQQASSETQLAPAQTPYRQGVDDTVPWW